MLHTVRCTAQDAVMGPDSKSHRLGASAHIRRIAQICNPRAPGPGGVALPLEEVPMNPGVVLHGTQWRPEHGVGPCRAQPR